MQQAKQNFAVYIRVSTQKQGFSGLGLEAQLETCEDYISRRGGVVSRVFKDIESGKSTSRKGLWDAIEYCKGSGESLVIAKLDRLARDVEFTFRVMKEGIDIHFVDMPVVNTIILGVFASVAQYERELTSKRTKDALAAKKERGELTGGSAELWGKNTGADRLTIVKAAAAVSAAAKKDAALNNENNKNFRDFIELWEAKNGKIGWQTNWVAISSELNARGRKTASGMEFTPKRAKAMYDKIRRMYNV